MSVYRTRKEPARANQLHMKSWRYFEAPSGANDPVWLKRAAEYWQLQAETYGIKYHDDMRVLVNYSLGIVTTMIHVERLLPGQRVDGYTVPRVAAMRVAS